MLATSSSAGSSSRSSASRRRPRQGGEANASTRQDSLASSLQNGPPAPAPAQAQLNELKCIAVRCSSMRGGEEKESGRVCSTRPPSSSSTLLLGHARTDLHPMPSAAASSPPTSRRLTKTTTTLFMPYFPLLLAVLFVLNAGSSGGGVGIVAVEAFSFPAPQSALTHYSARPLLSRSSSSSGSSSSCSSSLCRPARFLAGSFSRLHAAGDGEGNGGGGDFDDMPPSDDSDSGGFGGTGLSPKEAIITILGVNPLTLLLALAAIGMLSANSLFGPGWLRPSVGLKPTKFQSRNLVLPLDQPGFLFPKEASLWGED